MIPIDFIRNDRSYNDSKHFGRRQAIERNMVVRRGEKRDAETLTRFNRAMAHETEGKELAPEVVFSGVKTLLNHPGYGFYVVAEMNGQVVGSLMVTPEWSDWRDGFFWWIQSVYVMPEYRRRGIYRKLYEHVKTLAMEQNNVCGFRLYVTHKNTVAQKTYAALGMEETCYRMFEEMICEQHLEKSQKYYKTGENGMSKGHEITKGKAIALSDHIQYADDSIVSKTIIDKKTGTVTLFAFDRGQKLSEHTTPFDALVHVVDGEVELTIGGEIIPVSAGQIAVMPANVPHAVNAVGRFKMLLTMIRS